MSGSEGRRFRKQGEWNSNQAPRLCGHNRQRRPAISREPLTNTPSRTRAGTGLSESYSEPQSPESRSNDAQAAQLLEVSPTKHLGRSRRANVRFGSNLDGKFGWKADVSGVWTGACNESVASCIALSAELDSSGYALQIGWVVTERGFQCQRIAWQSFIEWSCRITRAPTGCGRKNFSSRMTST